MTSGSVARPEDPLDLTYLLADYDSVRQWAIQSMFDTMEDFCEGTVIVDHEARIVWINARYAARFGFAEPAGAIGRPVEEVIQHSQMREVVKSGKPQLLDIMPAAGHESLVVTRLPLKNKGGQVVGAIGFALFDQLQSLSPIVAKFSQLKKELANAQASLAQARKPKYSFSSFIGTGEAATEVKRRAQRAAQMDSPVLLLGETGTGKEVLAHAIHAASPRADKPLVSINMAAIPETLLEAELFGAAPGAYSGLDRKGRIGKFELADGGTLFLDEMGELPLALQSKLLRVLQDKEFEALGANQVIRADVRIIAATSARLLQRVEAGAFRADLFYRLNVLTIETPPLRDRAEDLPALCQSVLDDLALTCGVRHISSAAVEYLRHYHWPGNVRELRNVLERAIMLSDRAELQVDDLAALIDVGSLRSALTAPDQDYHSAMHAFEKRLIEEALQAAGGRATLAAQRLGIGRATLYKKMTALGISR
ncbi:sigma-54 interaction domain-containing protein [Silvimonas amylolytica]|uniref:Sigma-54-dependent Fis family transcriptional regulator n=1 Tax=Silvimonas amylolytica TaxID=449663 RepID=A0ABQ2PPU0_9NEIS|nr:sigma 54-interacting transcriptional regulator [Silvimonas amylolytica]GGP27216.1 sigma-54-dependent Fis family transcriptional regulator [Silvimonas amylolytica]